jgi:hypothetical protein
MAENNPTEENPYPRDWSRRQKSRLQMSYVTCAFPTSTDAVKYVSDAYEKTYVSIKFPAPIANPAEIKFKRLVDEWHDETDMQSSLLKVISHPAYLKIIAMGQSAIPMILREMKRGPGHWFPAIEALTDSLLAEGEKPARGCTTSSEARAAWVKWGESKGYL